MLILDDALEYFRKKIHEKSFVFAYPTEAVYGLGCNPFDSSAVERILSIKKRPSDQRFILIASDFEQIAPLIKIKDIDMSPILASWPGPVTWIFPAADTTPDWLITPQKTIALRITAHPVAKQLAEIAQMPLVSTSANISGQPPCKNYEETQKTFGNNIDLIINSPVGNSLKPTPIRNAITGEFLRN